jgi:hypothetical protein
MSNLNSIDDRLRNLARSSYWQNLYKATKECANVQLFENVHNFSGLQIRFLYYLALYDMLFEELVKYEDELLTENVLKDFDRTDAYLVYRNKKHEHMWKKYRREEKLSEHRSKHPNKHKNDNAQLIEVDLRKQ